MDCSDVSCGAAVAEGRLTSVIETSELGRSDSVVSVSREDTSRLSLISND